MEVTHKDQHESDNTRVTRPLFIERIEYKPKQGEYFVTVNGKKTLVKPTTISSDNRSSYQRKQDDKNSEFWRKQYERADRTEKGLKNFEGFTKLIFPSTYIGPIFNNNGKSYVDNVISGEGTGDNAGNVAIDMLTPFAIGGAKSLATGIIKYPQNVGRRAVETAMRTTPYANPIPEISNNFHTMLHGNNGGKGRLLHIGNYILTGKRVGPKGYYNSFAPFTQLNDIIVTNPSLGSRMKAFAYPEGTSFAFSGYVDRLGQVPPYTGGNDIIDTFLYQKTIDPKYGVRRINSDYGIHTDYVNKWYPNKKVQVYEVQNNSGIPEAEVTNKCSWLPSTEFSKDFGTNYDNVLNAAGHLKQTGVYNNSKVIRRQDIWKFNPTEYKQRWFENKRLYTDEPLWKKKLLDIGLRYVDNIGTPVITKTKWVYE